MKTGPAYVYRCYGHDGRLLYVGMSTDLWSRLAVHRRNTWWAPQVARVRVAVYPTRDRARCVERNAILREQPRWNVNILHGAAARRSWSLNRYQDYVEARLHIEVSEFGYRHLQVVQRECQEKLGHTLDIGSPPPPRPKPEPPQYLRVVQGAS